MLNPFRRIGDADVREADVDPELSSLVERIVRQELDGLVQRSGALRRPVDAPEMVDLLQWLGPWITQVVFDAVKLGMSLHDATAQTQSAAPAAAAGQPAPEGVAVPQREASREFFLSGPIPTLVEEPDGSSSPAPSGQAWLLSGHITLLVSPFDGFTEVQRFLRDLSRIPRVFDIKPKRFSGGRLYISVGTEYTDTQTLADILTTELSPYRPVLRSVQSDFVEFLLRQAQSSTQAG